MSVPVGIQGEFKVDQAWDAITALLVAQLAAGFDVAKISDRDFNDQGEIIMTPPSARVLFDGEGAASTSDSQRLSYNVVQRFIILVADQDLSGSSADQAMASLLVARQVKALLAGARILLVDGDISEPLTYVSMMPMPVDGIGSAYAIAFEVPGLAQFPGTNALPVGGN
jgi:hypothetical protein